MKGTQGKNRTHVSVGVDFSRQSYFNSALWTGTLDQRSWPPSRGFVQVWHSPP